MYKVAIILAFCVAVTAGPINFTTGRVDIDPANGSVVIVWALDAKDAPFSIHSSDSRVIDFGTAGTALYALEGTQYREYASMSPPIQVDWSMSPFAGFTGTAGYIYSQIHTDDGNITVSASFTASLRQPESPQEAYAWPIGDYYDGFADAHFISFTPDHAVFSDAAAVPEPSSLVLVAAGITGLAVMFQRKRRRTAERVS
jgi:hypothetical protein